MNVIVTGGAGFIGSHIVDALIAKKYKVWIIDNLSTGRKENINPKAQLIKMDIRSPKLRSLFLRVKPVYVFHLAAQLDVRASLKDPVFDADINILGSLNVIQASNTARVKKFIFTSSGGAVYGDTKRLPTPETEPENPLSPYGVAKLTIDKYLHQNWHVNRLSYTSIRFANVYGPRQNPHGEAGVIAIFAGRLAHGERCAINGTGTQTRDFVYVGDVVRAAMQAIKKPYVGPVNIATGKESSINHVYKILTTLTGTHPKPIHHPAIRGEQMRSVLSWKLAKKVLGWRPEVSLKEGLRRTVAWHKCRV